MRARPLTRLHAAPSAVGKALTTLSLPSAIRRARIERRSRVLLPVVHDLLLGDPRLPFLERGVLVQGQEDRVRAAVLARDVLARFGLFRSSRGFAPLAPVAARATSRCIVFVVVHLVKDVSVRVRVESESADGGGSSAGESSDGLAESLSASFPRVDLVVRVCASFRPPLGRRCFRSGRLIDLARRSGSDWPERRRGAPPSVLAFCDLDGGRKSRQHTSIGHREALTVTLLFDLFDEVSDDFRTDAVQLECLFRVPERDRTAPE